MADSKTIERFIELRAKGLSFDKIAKDLGKAKQTLIDWSKDYQEEIANLKALELEALQEQHYLSIRARLQSQAIIYNKLREEAEGRDFSEIPTEKLLELLSKHEKRLHDEHIEPQFRSAREIEADKADALKWAF